MSLDKELCLIRLLNAEENKELVEAWLFGSTGSQVSYLASATLSELNQRLLSVYDNDHTPVAVLTPNGKSTIKTLELNKGQLKFARQVIESTLEPSLASDIQDTHLEFALNNTFAHVCIVDKTTLTTWRTLVRQIKGSVVGLYAMENVLSYSEGIQEQKAIEFCDAVYTLSKKDVVGIPLIMFQAIHKDAEISAVDAMYIVEILRKAPTLLNLHDKTYEKESSSLSKILTSWYALPSVILLMVFILLEVGTGILSQKTNAIDTELNVSYKLMFPDERVISLHKQYEYKFNALRNGQQRQSPKTVYGILVALEKTANTLVGVHSIETLSYMGGQYSFKWQTVNRAQLDQIKQSLTRQGLTVSLVSWQKGSAGFVGSYLIMNGDRS